jgi:preprotein translocase subunit SecG
MTIILVLAFFITFLVIERFVNRPKTTTTETTPEA